MIDATRERRCFENRFYYLRDFSLSDWGLQGFWRKATKTLQALRKTYDLSFRKERSGVRNLPGSMFKQKQQSYIIANLAFVIGKEKLQNPDLE